MMESIGFLVFVLAAVYVIWWSFRNDDAPELAAIRKAAKIKQKTDAYQSNRRQPGSEE